MIKLYEYFEDPENVYLIMEYVPSNLKSLLGYASEVSFSRG